MSASVWCRLPDLGDRENLELSDTNPAGFAHLGAEIKMADFPEVSQVTGSLFPSTTKVEIRSAFSRRELLDARRIVLQSTNVKLREKFGRLAMKIPLLGRFIAHDTGEPFPLLDLGLELGLMVFFFSLGSVILGMCYVRSSCVVC